MIGDGCIKARVKSSESSMQGGIGVKADVWRRLGFVLGRLWVIVGIEDRVGANGPRGKACARPLPQPASLPATCMASIIGVVFVSKVVVRITGDIARTS